VVIGVGDNDIPFSIDSNAARTVEASLRASPIRVSSSATPRERRHRSVRLDFPHAMVPQVGDDDVTLSIDRNSSRAVEARL
jgi:hypothetical protein